MLPPSLPRPQSSDRARVLVLGQAAHNTGFARVLSSILDRLKDDFDIIHFGLNHRGEAQERGWRLLPNTLLGDPLGREQLGALLEQYRPHLLFICHDYWLFGIHAETIEEYEREHGERLRSVLYCPVEFPFAYPSELTPLRAVTQIVAYTRYGHDELLAAFQKEGGNGPQQPIKIVPHGLDTTLFRPLLGPDRLRESRRAARRILFPDRPELENAFIVLNANRNVPRKRMDLTLEAFAIFVREHPDAYLYLHMGMKDAGLDIMRYLERPSVAAVKDRLLLTTTELEKPEVTDEHLNLIYNACDVGLNTATGEGWGMVGFEHAATGAAQILPNVGACRELWAEAGILVPTIETLVSPGEVALALARLYSDPEWLNLASARAFARATSPELDWDRIARQWHRIWLEVLQQD